MVQFYCLGCAIRKLGKDFIFNGRELSKSFSLPLKSFHSCYSFLSASPNPYNFQSNQSVVIPVTQQPPSSGNCSSPPALPSGAVSLFGSLIEPAPRAWYLCLQILIMQHLKNNPSQDVLPPCSLPARPVILLDPSSQHVCKSLEFASNNPPAGWTEDILNAKKAAENRKTSSPCRSENASPGKEKW